MVMKLKGINSKKLKPKQKRKMQETLKRMEETRKVDDKHLRDILKEKLIWATQERQKGLKFIEETKVKVLKLSGMIILINDILAPKKEEK